MSLPGRLKELNRRLKMNGMEYSQWDTLNDRQHDIFTDNLFLDGECAESPEKYVHGAVDSCWCPDVVDDLHHHSPIPHEGNRKATGDGS